MKILLWFCLAAQITTLKKKIISFPFSDESAKSCVWTDERKLIRGHLVLYLHTCECEDLEADAKAAGQKWTCNFPHCNTMKRLLDHLEFCEVEKNCLVRNCSAMRQIIRHWYRCVRLDCPLCRSLRLAEWNKQFAPAG